MLGVAGEALMKNLGLIGVAIGLQVAMLLLAAPVAVSTAHALCSCSLHQAQRQRV